MYKQGFNLGLGAVFNGDEARFGPTGQLCKVVDLTQDGDIDVELKSGEIVKTKWRFVVPLGLVEPKEEGA